MIRSAVIALAAAAILVGVGCRDDRVLIASAPGVGGGGATTGTAGTTSKAGSSGAGRGGSVGGAIAGAGGTAGSPGVGAGGAVGGASTGSGGVAGGAGRGGGAGVGPGVAGRGGTGGTGGSGATAGSSGAAGSLSGLGGSAGTGGVAAGAGGTGGAVCPPCADTPRSLAMPGAKHMVVDPQRKLLYVTMPAQSTYPNALLVIDPATLAVTASVPLATEPNVLSLSPDASRLWVGVDGAYAIRSVDLSSGTPVPGPQFVLPHATNTSTNQTVGALTFVGGSATSLMLTLFANRAFDGLVILDNGVARAAPVYSSLSRLAAGTGNTVFGYDDTSTGFYFDVFTLNATGFTSVQYQGLVSDFNNDLIYSANDQRIYAKSGDVVNVTDPAAPIRTPGFSTFGPLALLPGTARALMLQRPTVPGGTSLLLLDTNLFITRSSAMWPTVTESTAWDLCVVGTDTVAFLVTDSVQSLPTRVVVVKTGVLQ